MTPEIASATVQARLLGDFYVLRPGEEQDETPWDRYDTSSQVLKFLLLQPRLRSHPSALVDALWPDVDADKASERLQFHVKRLRVLLRPDSIGVKATRLLTLDKSAVALDPAVFVHVDAQEFAAAARHALAGADVEACRAALRLCGGDLLPNDLAWPWTAGRRRELEERRLALLGHAAQLLSAAGDTRGAIPYLVDLLAGDPCNERAARLLMECYYAEDERAESARVYHTLRAQLQEQLHILPGAKTEELYATIRHAPAAPRFPPSGPAAGLVPAQRRRWPRPTELQRLVGRDEEISYVDLLLGMVQQRGGGYALFVRGEAGVGKTHFAHEILNRARRRGYGIMAGFARPGGSAPYAPVVEAVRTHVATSPEDLLKRVLVAAPGAATLMPDVAERLGIAPTAPSTDLMRRDLVHAVTMLSANRPTAFLLDDLHDADAATVAWLGDLLGSGAAAGLLVVATSRNQPDTPPALEAVIEECRRRGTGETLDLHGLSVVATPAYLAALLGRQPTAELASQMHDKTNGNPFLMGEIVRELRAHDALELRGAAWGLPRGRLPVPESVRELARARLQVLDDQARRLVLLASVAGAQPVSVLARLGSWGTATTFELLDRIVAVGIFEEREGYRFRHEMIREAIYDSQGAERRASRHATVAVVLEQDFLAGGPAAPDVAEVAHQFLSAGPDAASQAAKYAALAGDRAAAMFAHQEAADYYRAALTNASDTARAGLYERLGAALAASGGHSAAVDAFEQGLGLMAAKDSADEFAAPRILWRLGAALADAGRHDEAGRRLAEAEATLLAVGGTSDADERVMLHGRVSSARARLALEVSDLDTARDRATEALRLLEHQPEATMERLEVRNSLAGALFHRGRLEEAQSYLDAQLPDATQLGHPAMLWRVHANRGLILLLQGDLPGALGANQKAEEVLGDYHDVYRRTLLQLDRGEMQAASGAWDDAIATLGLVIAAAERESWHHVSTRARTFVAVPLMRRERFDEAREHVERSITAASRPGFGDEVPLIMALVQRGELHRHEGDLHEAAANLERAAAAAERLEQPRELVEVYLAYSRLCSTQNDDKGAAEYAQAALALAKTHGFALHQARAGVTLAGAIRGREPAIAREVLTDAITTLRICEARPDLADALTLLSELLPSGAELRRIQSEAHSLKQRIGIVA